MTRNLPALATAALGLGLGLGLFHSRSTLHAAETLPPARSAATAAIPGDRTNGAVPGPGAADAVSARAEAAHATLASRVRQKSHPEALRRAFQAYYAYRTAHPERVRKPYLFFVDYGLDNRTPRGYVFDMVALRLVDGPFTVAHGRGSAQGANGVPTRFTNARNSASSSLGLYLAQETYAFSGRTAGQRYHSIGLRLNGVSGHFNDAARARGVVAHGAPYVTPSQAGRSEGCPAMEESRARTLLPRIANGGLVFLFSPKDEVWLRDDPWSGSRAAGLAAASR